MAAKLQTLQTQETINVSQDAQSSPETCTDSPPKCDAPAHQEAPLDADGVLVKDSIEGHLKTTTVGSSQLVPNPLPAEDGDEDDLYTLSPHTETRLQAIRSSVKHKSKPRPALISDSLVTDHNQPRQRPIPIPQAGAQPVRSPASLRHTARTIAVHESLLDLQGIAKVALSENAGIAHNKCNRGGPDGDYMSSGKRDAHSSVSSEHSRHSHTSVLVPSSRTPIASAMSRPSGGVSAKERLEAKRASRGHPQSQSVNTFDHTLPDNINATQGADEQVAAAQQAASARDGDIVEAKNVAELTVAEAERAQSGASGQPPGKLKDAMRGGTQDQSQLQTKRAKATPKVSVRGRPKQKQIKATNNSNALKSAKSTEETQKAGPRKRNTASLVVKQSDKEPDDEPELQADRRETPKKRKAPANAALSDDAEQGEEHIEPAQQKRGALPSRRRPQKRAKPTVESEDDYGLPQIAVKTRGAKKTGTAQPAKSSKKEALASDAATPARTTRSRAEDATKSALQPAHASVVEPVSATATPQTQGRKSKQKEKIGDNIDGAAVVEDAAAEDPNHVNEHVTPEAWRKVGATQDNPVELSDNDKSSSLSELSSTIQLVGEALLHSPVHAEESAAPDQRQNTPPPVASSPPRTVTATIQKPALTLGNKPNFIGWTKSGPKNQGCAPPERGSSRAGRSSIPPAATMLDVGHPDVKRGPSSVATSTRSRILNQKAQQSNVACGVSDALDSFVTAKPPRPSFRMSSEPIEPAPVSPKLAMTDKTMAEKPGNAQGHDQTDAEEDPTYMFDFDGDTLVQGSPPRQSAVIDIKPKPASMATASQQAMPPPQKSPRLPQDESWGLPMKQTVSEPTQIDEECSYGRTHTTQTLTAPKRDTEHKRQAQPVDKAVLAAAESTVALMAQKKSRNSQSYHAPASKRTRFDTAKLHDAPTQQPLDLPSRPVQDNVSIAKAPHPRASIAQRKTNRHASYGPQTVDVNGSPVPSNVDVNGLDTVLQAYTQHATSGSKQDTARAERRKTVQMLRFDESAESDADDNPFDASPSDQLRAVSSNAELLPSSVVTATSGVEAVDSITHKSREPLREESSPPELRKSLSIPFDLQIPKRPTKSKPQHMPLKTVQHELPKETIVVDSHARSPHRKVAQNDVRKNGPTMYRGKSKSTRDLARHVGGFINPFLNVRTQKQVLEQPLAEDPEKTLVNDDQMYETADLRHEAVHEQSPSIELAQFSPQVRHDFSEPLTDDLMDWSKDKKPHQLNLTHELYKVVHRVVEYVSEQEQTFQRVLEERSKRELYMIEQEDLLRAKKYDRLVEELRGIKRSRRQDLKRLLNQINARTEEYAEMKETRKEEIAKWAAANRNMESLLARFA